MKIINLKRECGKKTITRKDGEHIKFLITDSWEKEKKITIDFSNLLVASVSFIDEAFGKLAFNFRKEELTQKLSFENIKDYDKALLNDILISRYKQSDVGENGKSR